MTRGIQTPLPAPPPGRPIPIKQERTYYDNKLNVDSIASFKLSPTILPKDIQTVRPFTGLCCDCLPISKENCLTDFKDNNSVCNILNVKPHLRKAGWLPKRFPFLTFSLQRRSYHQYPDVSLAVFTNHRLLEAIQKASIISFSRNFQDGGVDIQTLQTTMVLTTRKIFNKMRAFVLTPLIRLTGWFLLKFLSLFLRNILVHRGQMKNVLQAAEKNIPMIYLPLHRSHLDYILITFILWNYEIRAPFIAAGDNLNILFFNKLIRGLGGFFIRRRLDKKSGEPDVIYRTLLHTYLEELLKQGDGLEFFIEGGRTRSGKTNQPKAGLLSVITEACSTGQIPDAYIVPISISYDKLIDGNFSREQMGLPKLSESFWRAWKGILMVLMGDYGSVRMDFAQPFSLKEFIECYQPADKLSVIPSSTAVSTPDTPPNTIASYPCIRAPLCSTTDMNRHIVKDLACHVIHTAIRTTSLMTTNLLSFLLLTKYRNGTSISQLSQGMVVLVKEIRDRQRDIGFCGNMLDAVHSALELLGNKLINVTLDSQNEDNLIVAPNLKLPHVFELTYYSNLVLSVYILESIVASAIVYVVKSNNLNSDNLTTEIEVTKQQILSTAEEICKILEQEFIFIPPCKKLTTELADVLDKFITMEILYQEPNFSELDNQCEKVWNRNLSEELSWANEYDDEEDFYGSDVEPKFKVNIHREDNRDRMKFLLSVMAPTYEAYHTTAYFIDISLKTELVEDDFIKQLNHFAKSQIVESKLVYNESCAMDALKICIKSFHKLGILDLYSAGNLRIVGLKENFDIKDQLYHYIKLLEAIKLW